MQKNWFSNHNFGDGDLLDALTGSDGHLDFIKVHGHDDNWSIESRFENQSFYTI